ncbi:MAG: pyrroline-5-carboxylate reductase [Candidatus Palauibacterales bacterium]|nr:pyrroline-5-carboxylate reductase [Candidatus Palauibacterales bacterium]
MERRAESAERGEEGRTGSQGTGSIAILGGGNLGQALARGWLAADLLEPEELTVTRRRTELLGKLADRGCRVTDDNASAVRTSRVVVLAVQPQQVVPLLDEIAPALDPDRHLLVSCISDVSVADLHERLDVTVPTVRAMPNTAVEIRESMTCLSTAEGRDVEDEEALRAARELFGAVGRTLVIPEDLMVSATALVACGVAFFLRAIRAASQGGIEIGFHPDEAVLMAAQTARGAASLLLREGSHPEDEVDRVTTPRGCTIAGLNEMEHQGFSSALIKGIVTSAAKAEGLFESEEA